MSTKNGNASFVSFHFSVRYFIYVKYHNITLLMNSAYMITQNWNGMESVCVCVSVCIRVKDSDLYGHG